MTLANIPDAIAPLTDLATRLLENGNSPTAIILAIAILLYAARQ